MVGETVVGEFTRYRQDRLAYAREHAVELRVKNQRKRYLEVHPAYFDDFSLEMANPKLHYMLVHCFQTAAEREAAGRQRSFADQITANFWRAEVSREVKEDPLQYTFLAENVGRHGKITKEEARTWWVDEMTQRFLTGGDTDFDYKKVDGNTLYDDPEEERDAQDAYFDSMDSDFDSDGEGKEKVLTGETNIQDF
ncbi:hypothetical protein P280DRAFT_386586 [Massarina eburnea CBS 473.64]|uniref:CCD97-like C-terminal domain-containing protein n=1 Tax=Massarina eburnea CBS 473.64 TaxID=1395130 RepID=A0A6A6SH79_9PLEO|nr:hypothetical protein P280DRAFT_386586 [Massarina eburnea CBS 473.64]